MLGSGVLSEMLRISTIVKAHPSRAESAEIARGGETVAYFLLATLAALAASAAAFSSLLTSTRS